MFSDVYVVFEPADSHWIRHILNKDIGHCYILEPANGSWLTISKTSKGLQVLVTADKPDIIGQSLIVKAKPEPRCGLLMLDTCTGVVKQRLGIKNPFILTPYQLYKYLRRQHEKAKGTRKDSGTSSRGETAINND